MAGFKQGRLPCDADAPWYHSRSPTSSRISSTVARSATLPYALVQRAQMVLASAEGLANSAVARRFGVTVKLPQLCGATPRTQKATFSSTAMIGGWRDRPVLDLRLKR